MDILAFVNGTQIRIISLVGLSLASWADNTSQSFPHPLKIDRGTAITVNSGTNVANITVSGTICGYTEDNLEG